MFEKVKKKVAPETSVTSIKTLPEELVRHIDPNEDELTAASNKVIRKISSLAAKKEWLIEKEGELVEGDGEEAGFVEEQHGVARLEYSPQQEEKKLRGMDEHNISDLLRKSLSPKQKRQFKELVSERKKEITGEKPRQPKFEDTLAFWNRKVEQEVKVQVAKHEPLPVNEKDKVPGKSV